MRIDRTHRPWAIGALGATALSAVGYIWYASVQRGGPSGGTAVGLFFGIVGYAAMLFEGVLGLRKKRSVLRIGRVQNWMRGHLWIGIVTLPLILFHAGFAARGQLTFFLMVLLFLVYFTGILGAFLQHYLPATLTARVPLETIYQEIPRRRTQLCEEADEFLNSLPPDTEDDDRTRFRDAYITMIRPFLAAPDKSATMLATEEDSVEVFESLRRDLPVRLHEFVRDLQSICDEERQLTRERRIYRWLHVWLIVHVPLSVVLLILGGVHAIVALRY